MSVVESDRLSEQVANMVENLAFRIAEQHSGTLTANNLLPYLPMSFDMIQNCLDDLFDGASVLIDESKHIPEYIFTAYKESGKQSGAFETDSCVSCNSDLTENVESVFCPSCFSDMIKELRRLADKTGWPVKAVYEHEIIYLTAQYDKPVHAEDLAAHSRYTLRNMQRKLSTMSIEGRLSKDNDEKNGSIVHVAPEIEYPKEQYRSNMAIIRSFPASAMEEVQIRVVQILFSLGLLILGLLVLAFLHIPFPSLILIFLVAAPILALVIWRHRNRLDDE